MTDTTWPTEQNEREAKTEPKNNSAVQRQPAKPGDLNPAADAPNPDLVAPKDKNPNKVDHGLLHPNEDKKEGGKEMGLVKPPITSLHPTSASQSEDEEPEFRMIDNANFKVNHYLHESGHAKFKYPFEDMEAGQGMFIPVGKGKTTDSSYERNAQKH
jgi:hypothetical protein